MDRTEFTQLMAYLSAGVGKPMSKEMADVYYDLLGDLSRPVLEAAVKRALAESQYPVIPPVGVLRKLATEAVQSGRRLVDASEAWWIARNALVTFGFYRQEAGLASLPRLIRKAVECLGWRQMCDSTEPEILRAQFRKMYENFAERSYRETLLPESVKVLIEDIGELQEPEARDESGQKQLLWLMQRSDWLAQEHEKKRLLDVQIERAVSRAQIIRAQQALPTPNEAHNG